MAASHQMLSIFLVVFSIVLIDVSLALRIQNEELLEIPRQDIYKVNPIKRAGAMIVRSVPADVVCEQCFVQARIVVDRFNQYTYLNYYDSNPNVTNSDQLSGIKTCREMKTVIDCFDECLSGVTSEEKERAENYVELLTVRRIGELYCEGRYTPGYASCRLADTHRCDKIRRSMCGEKLVEYAECLNETLALSGQDCNGDCTPARRFLKAQKFVWNMECTLRAAYKSQCKDIVTIFCFKPVKDTDLSYGVYQYMDTIAEMANSLSYTCQVLESPFACMETATTGFYDYFGMNVTYACRGAEDAMDAVKEEWQSLIDPFCGENVPADYTTIAEVCPTPDPASAPLEVPIIRAATTTTTTERSWEFYEPKEGRCPTSVSTSQCPKVCGDDSHCGQSEKCCNNCCRQAVVRKQSGSRPRSTGGTPRQPTQWPSRRPVRRRKPVSGPKDQVQSITSRHEPCYITLALLLVVSALLLCC